jgi:hypothetical protein
MVVPGFQIMNHNLSRFFRDKHNTIALPVHIELSTPLAAQVVKAYAPMCLWGKKAIPDTTPLFFFPPFGNGGLILPYGMEFFPE